MLNPTHFLNHSVSTHTPTHTLLHALQQNAIGQQIGLGDAGVNKDAY